MTYEEYGELVRRAEAVAAQKITVESFAYRNRPSDIEERIKTDAAYMIARDTLAVLESDYRSALRQAALDGKLSDIVAKDKAE